MSFGAYTRLFFTLLAGGIGAMILLGAVAAASRESRKEEKRMLAAFSLAAIGAAFVSNAACGTQHKKMRARWGIVSLEESGKMFYAFDVPANLIIAALALSTAVGLWRGTVPIHL